MKYLFRNEEECVNSNIRVQQLQTKIIQSQQKLETLEQVIKQLSFFLLFYLNLFLGICCL